MERYKMKITEMNNENAKTRGCNHIEEWAAEHVLTECFAHYYNEVGPITDYGVVKDCVNGCYWCNNSLEVDLVVGAEDSGLWYLSNVFYIEGDSNNIYGYAMKYSEYTEKYDLGNDDDIEFKLVRFDN